MVKIATVSQSKNGIARKATTADRISDTTAEIQQLAYQFFVERGFAHGFDQEDWSRAEAIVKKRKKA